MKRFVANSNNIKKAIHTRNIENFKLRSPEYTLTIYKKVVSANKCLKYDGVTGMCFLNIYALL